MDRRRRKHGTDEVEKKRPVAVFLLLRVVWQGIKEKKKTPFLSLSLSLSQRDEI
jgi:hypothetical protein